MRTPSRNRLLAQNRLGIDLLEHLSELVKGCIYFEDYFIRPTTAAPPSRRSVPDARYDFVLPARPSGSRFPGGRRRRGNRACWPLPVTAIAVTGAVIAADVAVSVAVTTVLRGCDPAPAVTGTAPAVTAVAGRRKLSRWAGGLGLYFSPRCSRSRTKCSLARPSSCARSARHQSPRPLEPPSAPLPSAASLST